MENNPLKDKEIDIKLEEYKALRTEIIHFLERRYQNMYLAIFITLGVLGLGFGLKDNNYILFFTSSLLILFLWFDEIRRLRAIFRLGTYIQIFIESEVPGLKWETYDGQHPIQTSRFDRVISNAVYPSLFLINVVLGLYFMSKENASIPILSLIHSNILIILSLIIFCISIVLLIYLIIESISVSTKGRKKQVDFWNGLKKKMENPHHPQP